MRNNILAAAQQYRKEPRPEMDMGRMLTSDMIAGKLFSFHDRAHFFHLQTTSFAQHKMLDDVYNALVGSKDSISEYLLGVQAPQRFGSLIIEQPGVFSPEAVTTLLNDIFNFTVTLIDYADSKNLEQLANLASDLQGVASRAKYLNTLS